jgi:toxin ParE1/3/4
VRKIRWTPDASDQLTASIEHIAEDNQVVARKVAQAVIDRVELLATFPARGRLGEVSGTRELVSPPYVIVYRITAEVVEILNVWHGAQDWR